MSPKLTTIYTVAFFVFLALCTAQDVQQDGPTQQPPLAPSGPEQSDEPAAETSGREQGELSDAVREATAILRRVKPASVSKLARITSKPKGFMGSTVYYAKEAFVLLFMNGPKQTNLLTTSTSQSTPKLPQQLSKAVKLLQDAAGNDDPDALYLLAEMNFHGNYSHPVSYPTAFTYYKALADLDGNSTAQHMIAFLYATGLAAPEVPADQAKSMLYHTFAASQGDTRSQMTLAYRHHAGIATPKNCDEAVKWYQMVADKAVDYYRSGPPGGHSLVRDAYRIADEDGGVYGEGASVSSSGPLAKQGGPTSDAYAEMEDVLEYLYLQSSKGDLKATFGLARLYYEGAHTIPKNFKLAKQYFMQVAREYWMEGGKTKKDVPRYVEGLASKAAGYLGRMFLRGEGMEQSFSIAKIWFERGLKTGDGLCQYHLGLMYLHHLGVEQNIQKAADLFSAAADQDLSVAQTEMGVLFLDQGDVQTAGKYFELAARNSHIEAYYYLAEMNNQAIGRDRVCGMAALYYKIVAEKAEPIWSSLPEANDAYDAGDIQRALVTYLMAAEQGSENAQANVAWLLDQTRPRWSLFSYIMSVGQSAKTAVGDAALALTYWTRSAKQSNIDSLVKMGDYYLAGLGTVVSPENAAACYQAAAESMTSAQAMWNLGWMHENGIGIDQDFHLAKRFYDQALETNAEAYLPVKLSLFKLRWRSWWNDITHGGVKSMGADEKKQSRSFAEWLNDFLEADAAMYERELQQEADDWGGDDHMPGDDYWSGDEDEVVDGILETLLIGGLVGVLGWLIYYRQQQRRRAEERRRAEGQAGAPGPPPAVEGQQADGGFFPPAGDPNHHAWIAGGIGP
ncbi:ubiquitin protein ligase Sel1/Ubx2 [Teratosphaeria destructans]|uniref:Ubiquitin protein ligase Sel1/Ubx2 n=1 Tax=Teratosphaeria destructans TaxID=418781 RepID=A0A9W7SU28_9PEZI|nr:ubiquitin protein ligase Sel1/Ubx2 [Teratosphaeria destructans]